MRLGVQRGEQDPEQVGQGLAVGLAEPAEQRVLAAQEGITELAEDQLDILKFMREYYKKHKFFPIVRYVCKNVHQPRNCVTEKFMDPVTAWKIAGLPNPGEEVIMFKEWAPLGF